MHSFAPVQIVNDRDVGTERWLICMEAQNLHFSPQEDGSATSLYAKVETCRRLLSYARRNRWQVVHIHRRPEHAGGLTPDLRPIEGLEPLPRERVYFRGPSRPLTLQEDPFWRDAAGSPGAEALTIGHMTDRSAQVVTEAADDRGIRIMLVADALWRAPSDPRPPTTKLAPWRPDRSVDSRQAMATQALSVRV